MNRRGRHPELVAGEGLAFSVDAGAGRIAWGDPDWFGPVGLSLGGKPVPLDGWLPFDGQDALGSFRGLELRARLPVRASVRAYPERPLLVFRLDAVEDLDDAASGEFARPIVTWPHLLPAERRAGGLDEDARAFGHQYTEFALPTFADSTCSRFFLLPSRPPVVMPLSLVHPDGRVLALLPLDAFHEQIIAPGDGLACGWHGDLEHVPRGFSSELAVWGGSGLRRVYEQWGAFLRAELAATRPSRYADAATSRLSYWTDNGAAYWYRSEPGETLPETLASTLDALRSADVPVAAVELDSWFYPHQTTRPLNYAKDEIVPPTGMLSWEARDDILPDGVAGLARDLGYPPLILHSRHFSKDSDYFEDHDAWTDETQAHPRERALYDRLMAQAHAWGAVAYEQDWLVQSYVGVRDLRARPGRAREWQGMLDAAAEAHGLSLIYCMATPADFLETLRLPRVTCIRTSGDYRYLVDNASLWAWFLLNNAFARALGLPAFKDVFLSSAEGTGWDGDPHADVEALLSALSAGPVGIGDRRGRTDRARVLRTCRSDGVLVKPDAPIAALDACFHQHPHVRPVPLVAETYTDHEAGRWVYLLALHAWRGEEPLSWKASARDLPYELPGDDVVVYDWKSGAFERQPPERALGRSLAPRAWDYRVLCPLLAGRLAVVGDASRYATAGDRRLRRVSLRGDEVAVEVLGAPGEAVTITGWSETPPRVRGAADVTHDAATGRFDARLTVPDRGWQLLRITR